MADAEEAVFRWWDERDGRCPGMDEEQREEGDR